MNITDAVPKHQYENDIQNGCEEPIMKLTNELSSEEKALQAINSEAYQTSLQIGMFMAKYGNMLDLIQQFDFSNLELALLADIPLAAVGKVREELALR